MRRVILAVWAVAVGLSALATAGARGQDMPAALEEMSPIELTFAHFLRPGSVLGAAYAEYGRMIEERTHGKVKLRFFWSNSLVSPSEVLQAVGDGVADIGMVSGGYNQAELPLNALLDIPYNAPDVWVGQKAAFLLNTRSQALQGEFERNNLKWIAPYASGSYQLFLKKGKDWASADSLQSLTVRTAGGPRTDWLTGLGASPVFIPSPEVYEAVDRGVIEAFENTLSLAGDLRQNEVVGSIVKVDAGTVMGVSTAMNLDRWKSLPEEVQTIIIETGEEWGDTVLAKALVERESGLLNEWTQQGINVVTLDAESAEKLRGVAGQVAEKAAEGSNTDEAKQLLAEMRTIVGKLEAELTSNGYPWK